MYYIVRWLVTSCFHNRAGCYHCHSLLLMYFATIIIVLLIFLLFYVIIISQTCICSFFESHYYAYFCCSTLRLHNPAYRQFCHRTIHQHDHITLIYIPHKILNNFSQIDCWDILKEKKILYDFGYRIKLRNRFKLSNAKIQVFKKKLYYLLDNW